MNTTFEFTGPVNLGNPVEKTILQIANMIKDLTASTSPIVYKSLLQDDPLRRCPDITLAEEKLNWKPKVPLEKGLKHTIAYFEEYLSQPTSNFKKRNAGRESNK